MFGKKKTKGISSWEDVNRALREYGALELKEQKLNGELTERINKIKEEFEPEIRKIQRRKSRIEEEVEKFVYTHRKEIKGKTVKLSYGKVQIRQIPEKISFDKRKEVVAELLEKAGYREAVITKKELVMKKVKEIARKLKAEELLKLGIKVIPAGEKVNIVPDMEKIAELPEGEVRGDVAG